MKITKFKRIPFIDCDECGHERRRHPVDLFRVKLGPANGTWDGCIVLCRRCLRELKRQLREIET